MIRLMTLDDLPAAMRLKQAAGWNQTEQDWINLLTLEPEGCWVYEAGGAVAGSTTAFCYGAQLAWIGMVLVLPEFRRRGIARALVEHALEFLRRRGVRLVKLDATAMGQPLYSALGFRDECPIERWGVEAAVETEGAAAAEPSRLRDAGEITSLDRRAFGADRLAVLRQLQRTFSETCFQLPGAFVMARPGSNAYFLGPCVAERPAEARRLIEAVRSQIGGAPLYWDLLPPNRAALELAARLGFAPKRQLVRMSLALSGSAAGPTLGDLGMQFATAGFEYG